MMALEQKGYLDLDELKSAQKYPSDGRFEKGPVAVIECVQEIPCNPCEAACRFGAINLGEPITNLPGLNEEKCIGCGVCISKCPGLAIFLIDKTYSETEGTVSFPYEYYPLPEEGDVIAATDRSGAKVCNGTIVKVQNPKSFDRTPVVTVAVPLEFTDYVRGIDIKLEALPLSDDIIVCRCEEVTVGEIKAAIKMGARDVNGIKRRTRAGMGLCQGRTCEKMVQQILRQELSEPADKIGYSTARSPVRPVTFASLGGELAKSHKW